MLIRPTLLEPCWSLHVYSQAQEAVQYTILLAVNSVRLWYLFSCESFYSRQSGTRQHYTLLPGSTASYGERTQTGTFENHLVTYLANWPLYTLQRMGFNVLISAKAACPSPKLCSSLLCTYCLRKTTRTGSYLTRLCVPSITDTQPRVGTSTIHLAQLQCSWEWPSAMCLCHFK